MKKRRADIVQSKLPASVSTEANNKESISAGATNTISNQDSVSPSSISEPFSTEDIRLRAYHKWEMAGRPEGNDVFFWVEAEREVKLDSSRQ